MIQSKQEYLFELKKNLKKHPNMEEITTEIDLHITEMLYDLKIVEGLEEDAAINSIINKVGAPEKVAMLYQQEIIVTPARTQWTFILANILFFIGGIGLTIFYHTVSDPIVDHVWVFLTSIPSLIMMLYMIFWALLGYEIGKEFGLGGKGLLMKTFHLSLIPNLVLMSLVVLRIVPFHWFEPLLTPSFIVACIFCTILLYPISYLAFHWGTNRSI
ncbi:hypothetical protein [Bacillus sp. 03113]|uniref:hypothetical protein n=1 Tax=Bacillus sp. 03113 TaxID=2578211 RepID=UPI0011450422|nr:hypothetical protein [Bacillus sp. 03113]